MPNHAIDAAAQSRSDAVAELEDARAAGELPAESSFDAPILGPSSGEAHETLVGRVLELASLEPLKGMRVTVRGLQAITDADGRFEIATHFGPYDLKVEEPDSPVVTLYLGVTRRDPIFLHQTSYPHPKEHRATIRQPLSGGLSLPPPPGQWVLAGFLSERLSARRVLSMPAVRSYSLTVHWNGPFSLPVQAYAYAEVPAGDSGATYWFGTRPVTLQDGQEVRDSLSLLNVDAGVVAGRVLGAAHVPIISWHYRLGPLGTHVDVQHTGMASSEFQFEVANLTPSGAILCVGAVDRAGDVGSEGGGAIERCGVTIGSRDVELRIPAAAAFEPLLPATMRRGDAFQWQDAKVVHRLSLSIEQPGRYDNKLLNSYDIYTHEQSVPWSWLESLGVPFVVGALGKAAVARFDRWVSIDQATGSHGQIATRAAEQSEAFSKGASVTLSE